MYVHSHAVKCFIDIARYRSKIAKPSAVGLPYLDRRIINLRVTELTFGMT